MCGRYELHSHPAAIALAFGLAHPPDVHAALQHRADDGRSHRAGQCRGAARTRAHALGPRPALGQGPVDRRADDQCARRDDRRQAVVPHVVSAAPLPAAGQRLLRVAGTACRRRRAARKQPLHIGMADGSLFGLAGLYERWRGDDDSVLDTCTIVTTEANALVRPIHDRMPLIVAPEDYARWLDPANADVADLIAPYPAAAMACYPISRASQQRAPRRRVAARARRPGRRSKPAPTTSRRRIRRSRNRCSDAHPSRPDRGQLPQHQAAGRAVSCRDKSNSCTERRGAARGSAPRRRPRRNPA